MFIPHIPLTPAVRLQIIEAVMASTKPENSYAMIDLPSGDKLLLQAHFGHIAFSLLSRQADLFDQMIDVSEIVRRDMAENRDWIRSGARS